MHDIFLSYASEDRARASELASTLEEQGWNVWWDRTILPGKTFDRVIESELNAATCVIVLWSKISVESQWVRAEAGDALNKGRLIPALLEDAEIPLVFRQIQAASLLDWTGDPEHAGFIQLTRAIREFVSPALPNASNPATGDPTSNLTGKPETTAPKLPERLPDAPRESGQTAAQSKSGNRFTSLLWPATTISALLIAGLTGYLYWQQSTIPATPVTTATRVEPVSQGTANDPVDAVRTPAIPAVPVILEAEEVSRHDRDPLPTGLAKTTPRAPELATAIAPALNIKPPKPSQPAQSKPAKPKIVQPVPAPAATQKPVQKNTPAVKPAPATPQRDTTATRITKTMPATPAAPTAPAAPLKILMVVWGTPNDDGLASVSKNREYSNSLAQLMTGIVETSIHLPITFDYRYIEDRDHHSLMRDNPRFNKSTALCSKTNVDLLLFGFLEGAEFDMTIGYIPTREPFFLVFDCKSGKGAAKRFRTAEVRDDSFPYEKALTRAFRTFSQQKLFTGLNTETSSKQ